MAGAQMAGDIKRPVLDWLGKPEHFGADLSDGQIESLAAICAKFFEVPAAELAVEHFARRDVKTDTKRRFEISELIAVQNGRTEEVDDDGDILKCAYTALEAPLIDATEINSIAHRYPRLCENAHDEHEFARRQKRGDCASGGAASQLAGVFDRAAERALDNSQVLKRRSEDLSSRTAEEILRSAWGATLPAQPLYQEVEEESRPSNRMVSIAAFRLGYDGSVVGPRGPTLPKHSEEPYSAATHRGGDGSDKIVKPGKAQTPEQHATAFWAAYDSFEAVARKVPMPASHFQVGGETYLSDGRNYSTFRKEANRQLKLLFKLPSECIESVLKATQDEAARLSEGATLDGYVWGSLSDFVGTRVALVASLGKPLGAAVTLGASPAAAPATVTTKSTKKVTFKDDPAYADFAGSELGAKIMLHVTNQSAEINNLRGRAPPVPGQAPPGGDGLTKAQRKAAKRAARSAGGPNPYPQNRNPQQPQYGAFPPQGYAPQGWQPQAYPYHGAPPQGYPPQGYQPQGYTPQGNPQWGYQPQPAGPPGGPPPVGSGNATAPPCRDFIKGRCSYNPCKFKH